MKFFLDSANLDEIRRATEWGIIDGVTTNPTLVAKEKKDFKVLIDQILKIVDGPVSVEAVNPDCGGMVREAEAFSQWSRNVVVKIPMTAEGIKAVRILKKKDIKTNVNCFFNNLTAPSCWRLPLDNHSNHIYIACSGRIP